MPKVFYCSPTNSTFFTACCKVAILDHQQKCPRCKEDVYPFYDGMTDEEREYEEGGYYNYRTRMARSQAARK